MDAALLTEIEKLRRATLGELREKHRELFQKIAVREIANMSSAGSRGGCRRWPKVI